MIDNLSGYIRMKKIVLVTGANRGIGLEICRQLARQDMTVILTARDPAKGEEACRRLQDEGFAAVFHQLDVTDPHSIDALKEFVQRESGRLDVLVNNAGIGIGSKGAADADLHEVRQIMEINFYGAWRLILALLPLLRKSVEGRIINISSGMGAWRNLTGGYAGYRLSKTMLNALTVLMANELRNSNIKVNAMCPGWVQTEMGGRGAPRSVEKGAETAVWLATLSNGGPTGKFFRNKKEINW